MSLRFDADADGLSRSDTWPGLNLTMLCWVYLSVDTNAYSTVFDLSVSTSNYLQVSTNSSGTLFGLYSHNGEVTSTKSLVVGQWSRLAVTITPSLTLGYLADATGPFTTFSFATSGTYAPTSLKIGKSVWSGEPLNGRISSFKEYSAVLTAQEIENEFLRQAPVRTANLRSYYPLSSPPGTADQSGNGKNLTAGTTTPGTEAEPPWPGLALTSEFDTFLPFFI